MVISLGASGVAGDLLALIVCSTGAADPFADAVETYAQGDGAAAGYIDPQTALGSPERMTGEGVFPGAVTLFNPPWLDSEIVSIGSGGRLTLRFDEPVEDDPNNPFGIDLLIFGNAFFIDGPGGLTGVASEGGVIEVSPDGVSWATIDGIEADGLHPTQGYADTTPFQSTPGLVECDYTRPVNPGWGLDGFAGRSYEEAVAMYGGAGGGASIDLAGTSFTSISYVRIRNDVLGTNVEIDAVADVAPVVPGDADGNKIVNVDDLVAVILQWGALDIGTTADFDGSGAVDVDDLVTVIVNWSN